MTVIEGGAKLVERGEDGKSVEMKDQRFTAIPYFARANREPSAMSVFLLQDSARAVLPPAPSLATQARATASIEKGNIEALRDQIQPNRSADATRGAFYFARRKGTTEWVQYEWNQPRELSLSSVYWVERPGTENRLPKDWRLLYRDGDDWKPVEDNETYGTETDRFNIVEFRRVKTTAIRLEVDLDDEFIESYAPFTDFKQEAKSVSAAILEWSVE